MLQVFPRPTTFFPKKLAYIPTGMIGSLAVLEGKKAAGCYKSRVTMAALLLRHQLHREHQLRAAVAPLFKFRKLEGLLGSPRLLGVRG
jgi:hypothetical protein